MMKGIEGKGNPDLLLLKSVYDMPSHMTQVYHSLIYTESTSHSPDPCSVMLIDILVIIAVNGDDLKGLQLMIK